jgi:hypothetical protein
MNGCRASASGMVSGASSIPVSMNAGAYSKAK